MPQKITQQLNKIPTRGQLVLTALSITSLLAACGGGGSAANSDGAGPSTTSPTSGSATTDISKLQWRIDTPLKISLKNSEGVVLSEPLNCVAVDSNAVSVKPDCSAATVNRLGNQEIIVSKDQVSAKLQIAAIPQRQIMAHAVRAGSFGNGNAYAITPVSGTPLLWGDNSNYTLAQAERSAKITGFPMPGKTAVDNYMTGITSVSIGEQSALALNEDGLVLSWGIDHSFRLGRKISGNDRGDPIPGFVRNSADNGTLANIVQIGVGEWNATALRDDGHVYTWGWGKTAGQGDKSQDLYPNIVVLDDNSALNDVVQISVGRNFSLALTKNGQVYGWGANNENQTGTSDASSKPEPYVLKARPVIYGSDRKILSDIVSISAGGTHSLALTNSGQVYAWGSNESKALGRGRNANPTSAGYAPALVMSNVDGIPLSNITAISASHTSSLALENSGKVLSWGYAYMGALGQGLNSSVGNERPFADYVVAEDGIGFLNNVIAIGVNHSASYALTSDGSILAWGSNYGNELGQNLSPKDLFKSKIPLKVKNTTGTGPLSAGDLSEFKNLKQNYR